jgi:hypothetical protein
MSRVPEGVEEEMKDALKRAIRTAAQTLVASGVIVNISTIRSWADLKASGSAWAFAGIMALGAGVVSLIHNLAESETPLPEVLK